MATVPVKHTITVDTVQGRRFLDPGSWAVIYPDEVLEIRTHNQFIKEFDPVRVS